ncbi:MAG: hypothetical protein ACLVHE_08315 [Dialister invisus]|uniref:hypothetical protein n=1 Tax=Dialister invisus TaxID=218538 RepID=UPI00204A0767|nr:MAG TPA: hypothetical protein [Caudoviricetes sp.]
MTEVEEKNEHLAFLTLIERSKRQNALMHLKKALDYSECGVTDIELVETPNGDFVDVTFHGEEKRRANISGDSVPAMIYDIFRQIEWLR